MPRQAVPARPALEIRSPPPPLSIRSRAQSWRYGNDGRSFGGFHDEAEIGALGDRNNVVDFGRRSGTFTMRLYLAQRISF